ncbi:cytosine/adenosine deaminase-related metal-dependent hydrolase [Rathayibacter sp. PhB93]|uniref:8-oxoguanine deaminase n=1 Tax=unclassified Rathayibacter TaxID=2609250 RepID=UPI000F49C422|nr:MULTISPECIES: 8-oxoguanine deaminase [unclassified Rathayibacter]ROQ06501.1 cytosine/adenosine deaminase-related metal-dependent hydrolase [Rathayibacter sp. PhB93]TDQ14258.1 cytosine/adenosine deaminase-related metal-dependent hydrolase [Rathayibacter sp. PhB1]
MQRHVITGAHVATVDAAGAEHPGGHVVVDDRRIVAVGAGEPPAWALDGRAPTGLPSAEPIVLTRVDGRGHLLTPGLVNTHHHLYQWLTRGWAQDSILFDWLVALYPAWSRIDADLTRSASLGAMGVLARSGCSTVGDHHYVFPRGSGDIVGGIVDAATTLGLRLHATRGSMDLGESQGGLPPDFAVETTAAALQASGEAVERYHDASFDAMVRVAIAPCSPFSVTPDLLSESAVLARQLGVRLHTHGSETVEEDAYTREAFGMSPTDYLESLGWLGDDVWMAHGVHLDDDAIAKFAATGTGVAHCPSSNARLAAGIAPIPQLLAAGAPVGLGVDGAASNESGQLGSEIRAAVLMNRLRAGADRMSARQALSIATIGGARVLGRQDEIGSIEVGKLADLALWRIDGIEHAGIADPVAALALGAQPPLTLLLVNGRPVVADGHLVGADEDAIAREVAAASAELASRV